ATAGPERGKGGTQPIDAGELLPLGAHPADGASDLDAVLDEQQRGDGLDLEMPTDLELGVVERLDASREVDIILRVDGQRGVVAVREGFEYRFDEAARRTLLLDDGQQSVGQIRRRAHGGCPSVEA